jgi:hypothetical protein
VIHPVHFNWVGPATSNDCCLRIPAEDPRRFSSDSANWSPIQSGIKLGSHRGVIQRGKRVSRQRHRHETVLIAAHRNRLRVGMAYEWWLT